MKAGDADCRSWRVVFATAGQSSGLTPAWTWHVFCGAFPCEKDTQPSQNRRGLAMLGTILIVLLALALLGSIPTWSHSRDWGFFPSGGLGLILLIVVVLLLSGRI
jgi:hypothetical protein